VVTLFTSLPDFSVVFSLFCLFVFVVCLVLFSLVAAAFLANKDVYIIIEWLGYSMVNYFKDMFSPSDYYIWDILQDFNQSINQSINQFNSRLAARAPNSK